MAKVIIFRGKSATGKTVMSSALSQKLNTCVIRKDDIFDPLSTFVSDNSINSTACYDILAKIINENLNNNTDIIVDIALPHTAYYNLFKSKINFNNHTIFSFLCDCSDNNVWLSRWEERLKKPLPNQFFKNIDEIINYYLKMDIELLENETYIDSCNKFDDNLNYVFKTINRPK